MKTKAKVLLMRKSTGMFAAETTPGYVTVFEMLGCEEVKSGDILIGNMEELGNQDLYNESRKERLRVFNHETGCAMRDAIETYFAQLMPQTPPRRPMWPFRNPAPGAAAGR